MGTGVHFPEVKRLRTEVDHSSLSIFEVNNKWSYTSTPPTCLHGVEKDNFTFLLPIHGLIRK
jgi:hypothetical protein